MISKFSYAQTNMSINGIDIKMSGDNDYWFVSPIGGLCFLKTRNCSYIARKELADLIIKNYDEIYQTGTVIFRRYGEKKRTSCPITYLKCE